MKTDKTPLGRRPGPNDYRAARLRAQREAVRAVRRTLLVVAFSAGVYYCVLLATSKGGASNDAAPPSGVSIGVVSESVSFGTDGETDGEKGAANASPSAEAPSVPSQNLLDAPNLKENE